VTYEVLLTEDAERDLESLYDFILRHDSVTKAQGVLDQIEATLSSLESFPERGNHPRELVELGIHDYREAFFKPYRIIYRVIGQSVFVFLIVDGRRDMQNLLQQRLLAG